MYEIGGCVIDIPIEQLGLSGGTIIASIIGLISFWFKFQNKVDNLSDKDSDQEKKIQPFTCSTPLPPRASPREPRGS